MIATMEHVFYIFIITMGVLYYLHEWKESVDVGRLVTSPETGLTLVTSHYSFTSFLSEEHSDYFIEVHYK